ncbi:MAG: DUF362 domain-containing protein [Chloroflexi bacterium]|nr:DUF362 domain-containing protein [Chloroflexota bacterium]
MKANTHRRAFIRMVTAVGLGAAGGAGALLASVSCGGAPPPTAERSAAQPTAGAPGPAARPAEATAPPIARSAEVAADQPTARSTEAAADRSASRPAEATATPVGQPIARSTEIASPAGRPAAGPTAAAPTPAGRSAGAPTAATGAPMPTATPGARAAPAPGPGATYLAVARGESPALLVERALRALGGIERFVKPGQDVIVKPNICVAYHTYEYAATTNPEVVATLVKLSLGAGARLVRVMDAPFGGTAAQAYARSGIADAVKAAGGQMETMSAMKYQEVTIPRGRDITRWVVYKDAFEADVLIDVPIAKHHNLARLTLGMKNLMGLIQDREQLHRNLGQRIGDLLSLRVPTLTVVDAVRMLMDNGPTGGSLNDVKRANTVIASHDVVAADAYAATLFGITGADLPAVAAGARMGLGTLDLKSVKVEEIRV